MKKPIIAVDIDEVLLPLHHPFLLHHNETYETDFVYPDPEGRYFLHQFTGDSTDVMRDKLQKFYESDIEDGLRPIAGAKIALRKLHQKYELCIISSQELFQVPFSQKILLAEFGDIFDEMRFTKDVGAGKAPLLKSIICQQLGADYFIDDHLNNVIGCAEAGISSILFGDYHWNKQDDLPEKVIRCKDWDEVWEYFDHV